MDNQTNQTSEQPWRNEEGKLRPDSELKEISRDWSVETWEAYGATIEKELSRHEVICDDYAELLEEQTETIWTGSSRLPEHVHRQVHLAVRGLSEAQRTIIRGLFFHNLSERQLARKLKIAQQSINERKNLSLKKIKKLLEADPVTAAYLIGGSKNLVPRSKSRLEQIIEVYLEDLNGSYLT